MSTQVLELEDLWEEDAVEPTRPERKPDRSGEATLDAARAFLARFVSFPSEAAEVAAVLFAAHSHAVNSEEQLAFDTSPRIAFLSKEPGSGKTVAMETMGALMYCSQVVVDLTPASFAQLVHEQRAAVLLDEIDVLFGGGQAKSVLRSLLNAGYRRKGAFWMRANKPPVAIFGAVAFAGMDAKFASAAPLAALRSRTIMIKMVRTDKHVESYRPREHDPLADALRRDLTKWVHRHLGEILEDWPTDIPEGIVGRKLELAEPLLMIADCAGGHWPESARTALAELLGNESPEEQEALIGEQLLDALRTLFGDQESLTTVEIVSALYALPDSPWKRLWPNPGTAPKALSQMLGDDVTAVPLRRGDKVMRGYKREDLEMLWEM